MSYIFNCTFLVMIINKDDGWSHAIPNLSSKKWPGTLFKLLGPSCSNIAHSVFMPIFFQYLSPCFDQQLFSEYSLSSLYYFQDCIGWEYQPPIWNLWILQILNRIGWLLKWMRVLSMKQGTECDHLSSLLKIITKIYLNLLSKTYGKKFLQMVFYQNQPSSRHELKIILFQNQ